MINLPSAYQNPVYCQLLSGARERINFVTQSGMGIWFWCPSLLPWTFSVYLVYNLMHIFWGPTFDDFNMPIKISLRKGWCLFARQVLFSQNVHSILWRTKWLLLLIWIIITTNWFYDRIISQFVPRIVINYLKLMSFYIFAWCSKISLCKTLFLVCSHMFMTNSFSSLVKSHFLRACHLEDKFWKSLIHLSNNLSSRRGVLDGNVYVCEYRLNIGVYVR